MRRFALRWDAVVVVGTLFAFCGCGGSSNESTPQPNPVPAVCSTAFNTDDTAGPALVAGVHPADEPTAVALSSCKFDEKRNVQIGGPDGCGPDVVVDEDFTGANALGKITINSGGKLVFP